MIAHLVARQPVTLLWWALIGYGAGLAYWEFSVFFRGEHWSWADVRRGFIWPVLWVRMLMRKR